MADVYEAVAEAHFAQLVSRDLKEIAVAAQCLDNQWVSQDLLQSMIARGLSFEDASVARRRLAESRSEYLRGLLNAEQIIVNRGFFFNNPVVYRDFVKPGPARDDFVKMLSTGVIVPFLLYEASPGEPPRFTKDSEGWPAWVDVLKETHLNCLRLSWRDDENRAGIHANMYERFRRFVGSLPFLDEQALRTDLGLDADASGALMKVLREASNWAMDEPSLTREMFYQRFVVAPDSVPALGRFDSSKPFAGILKQLADLRYNTNLPDAIDRYPLTPADSLHRTALQEERSVKVTGEAVEPEALARILLRRRAFDLVQEPLNISMASVDLPSVWRARQTPEWQAYITDLQALVRNPEDFDTHAQRVYRSYVTLAMRLSETVGNRHTRADTAWMPAIKVVIEAIGATMSILYSGDLTVQISGAVAEQIATRASTVVVRFLVVNGDRRRARNDLSTGIDIMRLRFERTRDDWEELIARFRAAGVPVVPTDDDIEDDPGMDTPGDAAGGS